MPSNPLQAVRETVGKLRSSRLVALVVLGSMVAGCSTAPPPEPELTVVLAGQALIKKDPRLFWKDPLGTLKPIIGAADVAFTNFEMAVADTNDRCGLPREYDVALGAPELSKEAAPGDVTRPHAVAPQVMEFLASLGFNLMSLANNHAYDLGDCGVTATRAAAAANRVVHAGVGPDIETASAPAYLTVRGAMVALIAATTSHDERNVIGHAVNGVWIGWAEDRERSLAAVREAAARADFVIYYQHFQLDTDEFAEIAPGGETDDGHRWVEDVSAWQSTFARAVLDAGASIYVAHGSRAFDGIEVYQGKPLIRQLGGLAYQGLKPKIGAYDTHRPWEGLLAQLTVRGDRTLRIEFIPLELDEGKSFRAEYDDQEFLSRRGLPRVATGSAAEAILARLADTSARYGSALTIENGRAVLEIAASGERRR